jgi:hypothetical protein
MNWQAGWRSDEPTKSTLATVLKDVVLPIAGIAATLLAAWQVRQRETALLLGGLVLLAILGMWPSIRTELRRLLAALRIRSAARRFRPRLCRFAKDFLPYASNRYTNTLHAYLRPAPGQEPLIKLPDVELWSRLCDFYCQRLERRSWSATDFCDAVRELDQIVSLYNQYCVLPVFSYSAKTFREGDPELRSNLNSFQQRFASFVSSFQAFGRELEDESPDFRNLVGGFEGPKPL